MVALPLNRCEIVFELTLASPLVIAAESGKKNRGRERAYRLLAFVSDGNDRLFIPASTLKGMFRHHAERLCRTIESLPIPLSCDPLSAPSKSGLHLPCNRLVAGLTAPQQYRYSCPVCRLFGNKHIAGRMQFNDTYPEYNVALTANSMAQRASMAQDRLSGCGVPPTAVRMEALWDREVEAVSKRDIRRGRTFETIVSIDNFEVWQLGLTAVLLKSLFSKQLQAGRCRSRGLGKFTGSIREVRLYKYGRKAFPGTELDYVVEGIGALYSGKDREQFGFELGDQIKGVRAFKSAPTEPSELIQMLRIRHPKSLEAFFKSASADWLHRTAAGSWGGFAVIAQSLREEAMTLRKKEV